MFEPLIPKRFGLKQFHRMQRDKKTHLTLKALRNVFLRCATGHVTCRCLFSLNYCSGILRVVNLVKLVKLVKHVQIIKVVQVI